MIDQWSRISDNCKYGGRELCISAEAYSDFDKVRPTQYLYIHIHVFIIVFMFFPEYILTGY